MREFAIETDQGAIRLVELEEFERVAQAIKIIDRIFICKKAGVLMKTDHAHEHTAVFLEIIHNGAFTGRARPEHARTEHVRRD